MLDPRSKVIAGRLMAGAMESAAHRMLAGEDPHAARDAALREFAPAWSQIAGKDAADAATRGLLMLDPGECLTAAERRGLARFGRYLAEQRRKDEEASDAAYHAYLARLAPHLLPKPRAAFPWRAVAMVALVLTLAAGGVLALMGPSGARELDAGQRRWKALAACGVTSIKSPEYDRRCRQFSRTERSVVRDYDGPGAGGPRSWEQPKDWE